MLIISALILLILLPYTSALQAAPTINVSYELLTGTLPFDNDDTPGNDSSDTNDIVRTNDSLLVNFQLGISNDDETNVVVTASGSPGIEFSLPIFCLTSGVTPPSSISGTLASGQTATCNTGDHSSGTAVGFALPGRILPDQPNAATIEVYSAGVSGDNSGSQNFPGKALIVSAEPRFDIQKSRGAKIYGSAPGPNGEPGLVQLFPILVATSNNGLGSENTLADIVISDDLSGVSASALLFQGWSGALNSACFANGAEAGYEINNTPYGYTQTTDGGPGGSGAGSQQQSVFDSGNFSCPSVGAGGTATITIAGAELDGVKYPIQSFNGSALPVDERYLVSGVLAVWFPTQDVVDNNGELPISNTYIPQSFNSISGQSNIEPNVSNNTKSYVLRETTPGNGRGFFIGKNNGGGNLEGQTAKRSGDGSLVTGQAFNTTQRQSNGQAFTETDYNNLHLCTSFDNSKQILRKRSGNYALVTITGTPRTTQPTFTLEYGTGAFGGNATCADADSPDGWVSNPTTLPGGLASATKVRVVGDLIAPADSEDPTRAELRVYYTALSNPVGTIVPQWGTYQSDDFNDGNWVLSDYNENTALGAWGDRATLTSVVVRIDKDTNPSGTKSIIAGNSLSFELDWSATLFGTPPNPTTAVTITDTLPKEYAYNTGSASVDPVSITNNVDGTTTLVWFFPAAVINSNQAAITYDTLVKNTSPNASIAANTVVISSPEDPTPESARSDTYGVNILNSAILSVFKEAIPPLLGRDDAVSFRLSYANTGNSTLTNLQFIDVIPDSAWTRNPATIFNGTLDFVSISSTNNETLEYTKTPVSSLNQNPLHASNQPGGSTEWCNSFNGGNCPANAAEVTAFRATVPQVLLPTDGVQHMTLVLQPNGNMPNDLYSNNFSASADELTIPVTSTTAKARVIAQYDYGDAPATFGDAQHTFLEEYHLGSLIDAEAIALSGNNADGDDNSGSNDDDGITLPALTQGTTATITATVTGSNGYLQGWIDWNGDGSFDNSEQVATNLQDNGNGDDATAADGSITFSVTPPVNAVTSKTFARFRWSTNAGLDSATAATNGETEDYTLTIIEPPKADLELELVLQPTGNAITGVPFSTAMTLRNAATLDADNVQVNWPVPAGLTLVEIYNATQNADTGGFDPTTPATYDAGTGRLTVGNVTANTSVYYIARYIKTTSGNSTIQAEVATADQLDTDSIPASGFSDGEDDTDSVSVTATNTVPPGVCQTFDVTTGGFASVNTLGEYIITPDAANSLGFLWSNKKIDLMEDFDIELAVYLGTKDSNGADGMTFVLQTDPRGTAAQGVNGGYMGVGTHSASILPVAKSLTVEFDTWHNGAALGDTTTSDHTAVYLDGDLGYATASNELLGATVVGSGGNIEDGTYHATRYLWDATAQTMQYYFDGVLLATINSDLITHLGSQYVTFGFTGSTSGFSNLQKGCFTRKPNLVVGIEYDFSDAPTSGNAPDGSGIISYGDAKHGVLSSGPKLGLAIDIDGASLAGANADNDGADDDGIILPDLYKGSPAIISATVSGTGGRLQGWIDWNGNGSFESDEQVASDLRDDGNGDDVTAADGTITFSVTPPTNTITSQTFARFRWSTTAGLDTTTTANDGEVEDYILTVKSLDFGDAPSYADAAETTTGSVYLGSAPDVDAGSETTNGDASDDANDDGIRLNGTTLQGQSLHNDSAVTLTVNTSGSGRLYGWIDWDRDGVFGNNANEQVISEPTNASGPRSIAITPPNTLTSGVSYARFRYSTAAAANPSGISAGGDGEVEDYQVQLVADYRISGRVYQDSNVDGSNTITEPGIANLAVVLYDTVSNRCVSTRTNTNGDYRFSNAIPGNYQVYTAAGELVPTPQNCGPTLAKAPTGYLSTTGNTSASFTISNSSAGNLNFGYVKPPKFESDNSQTVLPNTSATYPHRFTAFSNGSVSFSISAENADPVSIAWSSQLRLDSHCDGELNSGDNALPANITVSAGQQICLLAKVLAPANTPSGASHTLEIQSNFTFGDGSRRSNNLQTRQDITRSSTGTTTEPPVDPITNPVGNPDLSGGKGKLSLVKSVWNVSRNIAGSVALPGETLRYTIAYENIGNSSLNELIINDNVPAFTQLVPTSMTCINTPSPLLPCTIFTDTAGNLSWKWATTDQLPAGAAGYVTYDVIIQ